MPNEAMPMRLTTGIGSLSLNMFATCFMFLLPSSAWKSALPVNCSAFLSLRRIGALLGLFALLTLPFKGMIVEPPLMTFSLLATWFLHLRDVPQMVH